MNSQYQPALAPDSQLACYADWLKVELAIRLVLTYPWPTTEAWQEVRAQLPWLLQERKRLRPAGWLN